jgi:hypothetical protein
MCVFLGESPVMCVFLGESPIMCERGNIDAHILITRGVVVLYVSVLSFPKSQCKTYSNICNLSFFLCGFH